jgi:hypothetical protein
MNLMPLSVAIYGYKNYYISLLKADSNFVGTVNYPDT